MDKMGGKPKMIYHDAETTFTGDPLQQWLVHKKIKPIAALTHAPVAERTIRTRCVRERATSRAPGGGSSRRYWKSTATTNTEARDLHRTRPESPRTKTPCASIWKSTESGGDDTTPSENGIG